MHPRKIDELFLSGNGTRNKCIIAYIQDHPQCSKTHYIDEIGLPSAQREVITDAWLAMEAVIGRSTLRVSQNGHKSMQGTSTLGKISPGGNYREIVRKAMRFGYEYDKLSPVSEMIIVGSTGQHLSGSQSQDTVVEPQGHAREPLSYHYYMDGPVDSVEQFENGDWPLR